MNLCLLVYYIFFQSKLTKHTDLPQNSPVVVLKFPPSRKSLSSRQIRTIGHPEPRMSFCKRTNNIVLVLFVYLPVVSLHYFLTSYCITNNHTQKNYTYKTIHKKLSIYFSSKCLLLSWHSSILSGLTRLVFRLYVRFRYGCKGLPGHILLVVKKVSGS